MADPLSSWNEGAVKDAEGDPSLRGRQPWKGRRATPTGTSNARALDRAAAGGWTVVSTKCDWAKVL